MLNMSLQTHLNVNKFIIWPWGEIFHLVYHSCPFLLAGLMGGDVTKWYENKWLQHWGYLGRNPHLREENQKCTGSADRCLVNCGLN